MNKHLSLPMALALVCFAASNGFADTWKSHELAAKELAKSLKYEEAIEQFKKAHTVSGQRAHSMLYNIAVCYRELKDYCGALKYYSDYLEQRSDAPERDQIMAFLPEAREQCSRVMKSQEAQAIIATKNAELDKKPPPKKLISEYGSSEPGAPKLNSKPGEHPKSSDMSTGSPETQTAKTELKPYSVLDDWRWLVLGAGVLTSAVGGVMVAIDKPEVVDKERQDLYWETKTPGAISLTAGGVVAVAGVVLLLTEDDEPIAPVINVEEQGTSIGLAGRF